MTTKWARAAFLRGIRTSPKGDERQWWPCPRIIYNSEVFVTSSFNEWVFFSWLLCFALQYMFIQIGSQTWASLSFVPPGWGANSSQSCRSCSFSGHKQRCWTVLSELRYKVAYNPNTFFLNWKQRSAEKAVEDALKHNKMYVTAVWTKTAKIYFKHVEEQVIQLHRGRFGAIYTASKTKKYFLKNSTLGNRLLFSELANIEFTCPENSNWWLLLPDSNLFLKFQNNFTAEFWATFSYWLLLQRFFWNFFGTFIMSMKADTKNFNKKYQPNFLPDAIFFEHQGPFKR